MANMREVNRAIKAAHPELKVEAVRGDGYVYFIGEGFDEIQSVYANPRSTLTGDMISMCVEAVSEFVRIKALADSVGLDDGPAEKYQAHHFFAGTRYGWAVSNDYDEAIKEAASLLSATALRSHNRVSGGLLAVVCRVELPVKAHYTISNYVPSRIVIGGEMTATMVPISKTDTIRITSTKGDWSYASLKTTVDYPMHKPA